MLVNIYGESGFPVSLTCYLCFQVVGRSSGTVIPPPLVRGGQHVQSKHNSQIVMPPLVRGAQVSVCHQHSEPRLKGRGCDFANFLLLHVNAAISISQ